MRVFVVDDEKIICETLTTILIREGFSTRGFIDPLHALCAARFEAPDLLISDVAMPTLSGIELAIRMLDISPYCKVLLISGQAVASDLLLEARELGHDFELIAKPFHPTELLAHMKRMHAELGPVPQALSGRKLTAGEFWCPAA